MNIYNLDNLKINSIIHIGSECDEGQSIEYPGYQNHYELIYCLSGECDVLFQNIKMKEKQGTVRFLPKQIENNRYTVNCIKHSECIDVYFSSETPLPCTTFIKDYSSNSNIRSKFIKIHNTWAKKQSSYYNKCISLFFDILSEMENTDLSLVPRAHISKILPGVEYIHNHYCDLDFDYSHLADLCSMSYTYFKRLFRNTYNINPSEYIKNLKIQNACELLLTKHFSVTQVAEKCGYENIYYFSKVFKDTIGVPPSEYEHQE